MRNLGYSTLLLAASLAVAPACTKKDDASADSAEKKTDGDGTKTDDKKTDAKRAMGGDSGGVAATGGGSSAAALALIPDQAEVIIGLGVGPLMSSPFYKLAEAELNADPEAQKMLTLVKDCGLDPQKLEHVVGGISQDENFVLVMVGEGLGDDKKAHCLISGVQQADGGGPAGEVTEQNGKKSIPFSSGRAYLVDGRTLALVSTAWDSAMVSLIDGSGRPAISNSKKDLFAKVNTNATMWGLANIPPEVAAMVPMFGAPAEFGSVKSVTGSVNISDGAAVEVLAGFGDEATAKSVATQLQGLVAEAGKEMPAELSGMAKNVKIEAVGGDVKVALTASADELTKLQSAGI